MGRSKGREREKSKVETRRRKDKKRGVRGREDKGKIKRL